MADTIRVRMIQVTHGGRVEILARNGIYWRQYNPTSHSFGLLLKVLACMGIQPAIYPKQTGIYFNAISRPCKSELSAHKADVEDCPRCDSCGIELGEDVGYYGPGMKWIDASVALYPWRGEYYCDGCLSEEFYMLRQSEEAGSVTVFFGAGEMDMPDELAIKEE